MAVDNTSQRALTIPITTCLRFSVFPLTWLCYLGFTICGREGHISDSPDGSEITYRPTGPPDNEPPVIQPGVYYYVAKGESYFNIPFHSFSSPMLDPLWLHADMMDDRASFDRSSFETATTSHSIHFRRDIINRDTSCVMTGETAGNCQACHIIPHSKGDEVCSNIPRVIPSSYSSASILSISPGKKLWNHPSRASMKHGTDCYCTFYCIVLLGSLGLHFCE